MAMSTINKVIQSIERMHGDPRAQQSKHESYCMWLLRQREKALGESNHIIKLIPDEEVR
jgi:hypothetical protein